MKRIEEIDQNLQGGKGLTEGMIWYDVRKPPFRIYGLYRPEEPGKWRRLPTEVAEKMSEGVTVTGSNFRDNGLKATPAESCHFSACFIDGLVLMGNTCGASDPANVPECGFVIHHVENGTVSSNVLRGCARHTMRLDALRKSACAENNLL